jgi:hypothetical protein
MYRLPRHESSHARRTDVGELAYSTVVIDTSPQAAADSVARLRLTPPFLQARGGKSYANGFFIFLY